MRTRRTPVPRSRLATNRGIRHLYHDVLRESAWVDISQCKRALLDDDICADPVALEMVAQQLLGAAKVLQVTGIGANNLPPADLCPT